MVLVMSTGTALDILSCKFHYKTLGNTVYDFEKKLLIESHSVRCLLSKDKCSTLLVYIWLKSTLCNLFKSCVVKLQVLNAHGVGRCIYNSKTEFFSI